VSEAEKTPREGEGQEPEQARARRRFTGCIAAFLVLAAAIAAVPITLGTIDHFRKRAERRIVSRLHAYRDAQYAYHGKDRDNDGRPEYARDYSELVSFEAGPEKSPPSAEGGEEKVRVDQAFAAARGERGEPLHGYLFREMRTIWGIPINWDGDFAICAAPAKYGETGRKTYIMKTDGEVWAKDPGKSRLLRDFPNDAEAKGWKKVEPERD